MAEPFSYAIYRLVPDIERGERINVGVVVFSRPLDFLAAATRLDAERARALAQNFDLDGVRRQLAAIERVAAGDSDSGPIARLDTTARFHWLVAPSSTIIQPSSVHTGVCDDPGQCLAELLDRLVG